MHKSTRHHPTTPQNTSGLPTCRSSNHTPRSMWGYPYGCRSHAPRRPPVARCGGRSSRKVRLPNQGRPRRDIGGGDGLGPKTRPDDIADAPADSDGSTAIRLDRGWLWVSTLKHTAWSSSKATTPELSTNTESNQSAPSLIMRLVGATTRLASTFSMVCEPSSFWVTPSRSPAGISPSYRTRLFSCFVDAVLAPGLGESLQLNFTRIAAQFLITVADLAHFLQRQEQVGFTRQLHQRSVVKTNQHFTNFKFTGERDSEGFGMERRVVTS